MFQLCDLRLSLAFRPAVGCDLCLALALRLAEGSDLRLAMALGRHIGVSGGGGGGEARGEKRDREDFHFQSPVSRALLVLCPERR